MMPLNSTTANRLLKGARRGRSEPMAPPDVPKPMAPGKGRGVTDILRRGMAKRAAKRARVTGKTGGY